jgi:capsular polysaccharide transport system permease protein
MSTAPEGSRSTTPETLVPDVAPIKAAPAIHNAVLPAADAKAPNEAATPDAASSAAQPAVAAAPKPVKKKPAPAAKPTPSQPPAASPEQPDEGAAAMAIAPRGGAGAARALRKKRARAIGIGLAVWVGIPFVLSLIYYGLVARPEYESVAQLAVRGQDVAARVAMLREHMVSRDMLAKVEAVAPLSNQYETSRDPWTRFLASSGSEGAYQAFRRHVTADADAQTGIVTLRVRALSGAEAQAVATTIGEESQRFLSSLSGTGPRDASAAAKARFADVEARLLALEQTAEADPKGSNRRIGVQREILQKELESALRGLEAVLHNPPVSDALVVVSRPSLPREATYPRRVYGVASVLFISLLLFGIASLMIAAVREHAQF